MPEEIEVNMKNRNNILVKNAIQAGASADQIFVPFYTTKPDGSGLGLSLSRQIMRLHNGTITLERSDERMTTFVMEFK